MSRGRCHIYRQTAFRRRSTPNYCRLCRSTTHIPRTLQCPNPRHILCPIYGTPTPAMPGPGPPFALYWPLWMCGMDATQGHRTKVPQTANAAAAPAHHHQLRRTLVADAMCPPPPPQRLALLLPRRGLLHHHHLLPPLRRLRTPPAALLPLTLPQRF